MLLKLLPLLALLVNATPIADVDANTNFVPTPSISDKPSIVARAPLKLFTQNLDVNDPGPGGHHEKGGPKEKSWIDNMATSTAKKGPKCPIM